MLETPCTVVDPSLDQLECRNNTQMSSVFSDPECLVRIGAERSGGGCTSPPATVDGPDGPLRVNPLPDWEGPSYTRQGQPDDGPAYFCAERPVPTPLYDLVPAEVGWATLVELTD